MRNQVDADVHGCGRVALNPLKGLDVKPGPPPAVSEFSVGNGVVEPWRSTMRLVAAVPGESAVQRLSATVVKRGGATNPRNEATRVAQALQKQVAFPGARDFSQRPPTQTFNPDTATGTATPAVSELRWRVGRRACGLAAVIRTLPPARSHRQCPDCVGEAVVATSVLASLPP